MIANGIAFKYIQQLCNQMPYSLPHISLKESITPPPQKPILNLNSLHPQSSNHHHSSLHLHCRCLYILASFNNPLNNAPSETVVKCKSFSILFTSKFRFQICHKHCSFLFELVHLTKC